MAKHDILVWNTTSSIFETNLGSNTARIKGDSANLLSLESGSTELLKINTSDPGITLTTPITASGDLSGSLTSTGSFGGDVRVTRLSGNASLMTDAASVEAGEGHLSSSAQIATAISGAFDSGFAFDGNISGSSTSTGSFNYIYAEDFDITHVNELVGLVNVSESFGTLSGSNQIASDISGAFNSGFIHTGQISGSVTSTGSFGRVDATLFIRTGSNSEWKDSVVNLVETAAGITGSSEIASDISGSFTKGFTLSSGTISGSVTSTGSFNYARADNWTIKDLPLTRTHLVDYKSAGTLSGSAQIASAISGAFNSGFRFDGAISGSITSTGSFDYIHSDNWVGSGANLTNINESGHFSGSAQMAANISGAFDSGFIVSSSIAKGARISGSITSTGSFDYLKATTTFTLNDVSGITNVYDGTNFLSSSAQIAAEISGAFTSGFRMGSGSSITNRCMQEGMNFHPIIKQRGTGVYSTAAGLSTARYNAANNKGTAASDTIMIGGTPTTSQTEKYDGTGWSVAASAGVAGGKSAGAGSQNATLKFGGYPDNDDTEEYNGSAWSEGGNMITGRGPSHALGGSGTQNAGLAFGGNNTATTEEYNGVSWAAANDKNHAGSYMEGVGTQNDTVVAGVEGGSNTCTCTERYNGTSWTIEANMLVDKEGSGFFGTSNAAVIGGGYDYAPGPGQSSGEQWNGSTWSTDTVLPSNILRHIANGSVSDAVLGGWTPAAPRNVVFDYEQTFYEKSGSLVLPKITLDSLETEDMFITGSAVKIPIFSSTFNVDTRHSPSKDNFVPYAFTGSIDDEYLGSEDVGQLFITNDGRLNFTYPTASVGYSPGTHDSASYGSWAIGPSHITTREGNGQFGNQNATIIAGGMVSGYTKYCTEEFNGLSWSKQCDLTTARSHMWGAGSVNAGLAGSGYSPSAARQCTEEFNGNSWATGGNLIQGRGNTGGTGTQNAALTAGGRSGPTKYTCTEQYDGSVWSEVGTLATTAYTLAIAGTQNAALASGGNIHGAPASNDSTCVEHYNGLNWSSGGSLIISRRRAGTAGVQNAAWITGGDYPGFAGTTSEYDGTSWTQSGTLSTGRGYLFGGGDVSAGIAVAGKTPTIVSCTELYYGGHFHGTLSAWSQGGALITANAYHGATGIQNAALSGGGTAGSKIGVEEYDGSTWAAAGSLIVGRADGAGMFGSTNAAGFAGGSSPTLQSSFEKYNGYVWTLDASLNTARRYNFGAGSQNAGLSFGGYTPSGPSALTEEYNGMSWTEVGDLTVARHGAAFGGTQNAAWVAGGSGGTTNVAASGSMETWNGETWSTGGNPITHRHHLGGSGTQNAAVMIGGVVVNAVMCTEHYDGTSWSEQANLLSSSPSGRYCRMGAGSQKDTLAIGGAYYGGCTTQTEEFQKTHSGKPYLLTKKIKVQE